MDKNILLVEDDENLGFLLTRFLSSNKLNVTLCKNGKDALNQFEKQTYDLIILDVMLPFIDGFSLAKELKKLNNSSPFLFLTARNLVHDKIEGFKLGADDYISKPFNEDELLCRIDVILRRQPQKTDPNIKQIVFNIGIKYHYYPNLLLLQTDVSEKRLTEKENDILNLLFLNKNSIVKKETLLTKIWGTSDYFTSRSLDVFIARLRKYFEYDDCIQIENIRSLGYIFKCD